MRPRLTIAIPTYNRAIQLKQAVDRVLNYKKDYDIEVMVSDNASTDNTKSVVEEIRSKNPEIKYYRNDSNLGFDGNFLNCLNRANGKYVWLLSDDDVLLEGAIESVLEAIEKNPVCINLNNSSLVAENPLVYKFTIFKEEGLIEFKDKNDFLKYIGIHCTFVSSLVYNVDLVRKIVDKEQYFNTNILQSHIFFETLKNNGLYIVNTYNCLAARANETLRYDVLRTWVYNYSQLLLNTGVKCGFAEDVLMDVLKAGLSNTIYDFILTFRPLCENEKNWDRNCIWEYLDLFPRISKKYKVAINCSYKKLRVLKLKYKIERKIGLHKRL